MQVVKKTKGSEKAMPLLVMFLICKSLWITVSSKWGNLNGNATVGLVN